MQWSAIFLEWYAVVWGLHYADLRWFAVICGDLWWFAVICGFQADRSMTVNVPSVDSVYSSESSDGTLTESATKTVLFQYSKYTYFGGRCEAGAAGAVLRDTRRKWKIHYSCHILTFRWSKQPITVMSAAIPLNDNDFIAVAGHKPPSLWLHLCLWSVATWRLVYNVDILMRVELWADWAW